MMNGSTLGIFAGMSAMQEIRDALDRASSGTYDSIRHDGLRRTKRGLRRRQQDRKPRDRGTRAEGKCYKETRNYHGV